MASGKSNKKIKESPQESSTGFFIPSKMQNVNITGIVIAGGKSSRMGTNKALLEYRGKRLIDNAIQILQHHTQNILISSNEIIPNISFPFNEDEFIEIGPMGGLYSCLKASKTELNLIIPCDVPNIKPSFYKLLMENSDGFDAIIPRLPDGKLEPLIACYKKSILPIIKECIYQKDYKMVRLLEKLNVKYIEVESTESFKNINSPKDLL